MNSIAHQTREVATINISSDADVLAEQIRLLCLDNGFDLNAVPVELQDGRTIRWMRLVVERLSDGSEAPTLILGTDLSHD